MKRDGQAYKVLTQLFEKNSLLVSVSEIQGVVFGYLTATEEPCFESWVEDISDLVVWDDIDTDLQTHLKNIFIAAHVEVVQSAQHFTFITPSHEAPVASQLTAISDWARGCLYGIGLGALSREFFENPDLEEAVNDLAQIAQIELSHAQDEDVQEDLEYCFSHVEAVIGLLYRAVRESMHEE